jgi:hypothetical protein
MADKYGDARIGARLRHRPPMLHRNISDDRAVAPGRFCPYILGRSSP